MRQGFDLADQDVSPAQSAGKANTSAVKRSFTASEAVVTSVSTLGPSTTTVNGCTTLQARYRPAVTC
jgi:hypothetical protein